MKMMPVVCLSREAFPVITYSEISNEFIIGETYPQLPIIAGSIAENGRVLCFSQIQFLLVKHFLEEGNKKLIVNSLRWLSGSSISMVQILALDFDKQFHQPIHLSLQELGYDAEFASAQHVQLPALKNFKVIMIPSEIDLTKSGLFEALIDYTHSGGGLAVFFNTTQFTSMTVPINRLLLKFHLAYTLFTLEEDSDPVALIPVPDSYQQVRDVNLIPLLARFKATVKQSCVDDQTLDDVVTALRCYVMVCDDTQCDELEALTLYSVDFLERTNYRTPSGVCPDVAHSIIALLLFDLSMRLPPSKVTAFREHESFPGATGAAAQPFAVSLTLTPELDVWKSTGLYLPAGQVGVITCDPPQPDVHVQVGSHQESLIGKQGPWLRWPLIVALHPLDAARKEIATPFGGIVYIVINSTVTPQPIALRFENFVRCPTADAADASVWEATKDSPVPWGELVAGAVTFTVPTAELARLDVRVVGAKFRIIVEEIRKFIGVELTYRLVFDIEMPPDGASPHYPLVFPLPEIGGILAHFDAPCPELFHAVQLMAAGSIRENSLDPQTEMAVAAVVTAVIFQKLFVAFDPNEFDGIELPELFGELWIIQNADPAPIPATVAKFQEPEWPKSDVPDDMWISFVRELCKIGGKDFTKVLERSKPIPLNISQSLQGLPQFIP
jgi:hypothetical protein